MGTPGSSALRFLRTISHLSLMLGSALALPPAQAQEFGTISGRVTDTDGKPLSHVQVMILGSPWGGSTEDDGAFRIPFIPVGTYTVRANLIGYEDQTIEGVKVERGQTATVSFAVKEKPLGTIAEVEVVARRNVIKPVSTIEHEITGEDAKSLPVDDITELIGLKAGVVVHEGQMHFRGGRGGEVKFLIDGVAVRDPLVGGTVSPAALAVENVEQIMGGLDAEYGNAQSGVVNYVTKEGGERLEGEIQYITDDYGQPDNTFDNLDRVFVGVGGPSFLPSLTYYLSAEGTFSDNYPATDRRRSRTRLLNFISVGDRQNNQVRLQGKLAYRPGTSTKLTFEMTHEQQRYDRYYHIWSRSGWVETFIDTTQTGAIVRRAGRWSDRQVDSTYVYYNAAEHTPSYTQRFQQLKWVWTHTLDAKTFYSTRLSRNHFSANARVRGKNAWEYEGTERDLFFNYRDNAASEFFVVNGDFPTQSNRVTTVYTLKTDLTRTHRRHTIRSGFEATYNDMRYLQIDRPYLTDASGVIGQRTRYHYYNPEGAWYVKDQWEHEGMVLNAGLRYDVFSVGRQLTVNEARERVKEQWSPRIGIAYPISDRDVFSFHYGRFYQIPDRRYIFDDREVTDGRTRGNPNLTNETNVSYQAGIQHLFNEVVSGQFAVYYRDVFGLIRAEEKPVSGNVGNVIYWVNKDYASARGFEATLTRRFANSFSGEINYGFQVATGVASDPNAAAVQNFTYLPISEQPLDWDVRHTFRVACTMASRGAWLTSFIWQYESGFPYTPWSRNTRELRPEVENSRRLPPTASLDIRAEKYYEVWGQRLKVFLDGRNVLDSKNITALSPSNWPLPPGREIHDYETYYTETGRGGGAYVGQDVNGDGVGDWVQVNDPRVFGDPRSVRIGVGYSF